MLRNIGSKYFYSYIHFSNHFSFVGTQACWILSHQLWTDGRFIAELNYFGMPIHIYSFISMLTISVLEFSFREHVKSKDKNKE